MAINKQLAVRLGKICMWVYDFNPVRKAELLTFRNKLPQVTKIEDDQDHTSFAGIVEYTDMIVVAFQGTITEFGVDGKFRMDSLIDWLQNFRVKQLKTSKTKLPGLVHEGFFSQLDLIADKVVNALPTQGNKPIVVTGHSQGGAVATLATKRLADLGFPVREAYTFAAPRSGDAAFVKSIKTPIHRIEFGDDIVPHVPPTLALGTFLTDALAKIPAFAVPDVLKSYQGLTKKMSTRSYVGAGRLTYGSEGGDLLADRTAAQEQSLFKKRALALMFAGKDLVEHHHMPHYIDMFR